MYIGYTNRCIYVENKKRKMWRGIAIFTTAFVLGCATMRVIAWDGGTDDKAAVTVMGESILQENNLLSSSSVISCDFVPEGAEISAETTVATNVSGDKRVVVIDPGHGGEDIGCSKGNVLEKDLNLLLACRLKDKLEETGYEVIMTREDDTFLSLEERVQMVNETSGDILVVIHQNAFEDKSVTGIETWYCGEDSRRLSQLLHKELVLYTDANGRGSKEKEEFKLIREAKMPSCLVETGFLSNTQECNQLCDEIYQAKIVEGMVSGIDYYFEPKTMYLTFDDGPTAENTNTILDILKEKNVKATFFVVGENVKKNPEVAKRIVAEGHTIGIHCNRHNYKTLYESVDSYLEDFEEAYRTIYEVTGVEVKLFRFPGGSLNAYNETVSEEIIKEMEDRGFIYFDWNASLEDASRKNEPEQLIRNAQDSTMGRRKVVMLAHDMVYHTTLCLDELIEQFPEYRMEPLTPEVEPIQFNHK